MICWWKLKFLYQNGFVNEQWQKKCNIVIMNILKIEIDMSFFFWVSLRMWYPVCHQVSWRLLILNVKCIVSSVAKYFECRIDSILIVHSFLNQKGVVKDSYNLLICAVDVQHISNISGRYAITSILVYFRCAITSIFGVWVLFSGMGTKKYLVLFGV